jgi:hypothetical protein
MIVVWQVRPYLRNSGSNSWTFCLTTVTVVFDVIMDIAVSWVVGARADHLRKIPYTQKCKQVNRRNIIPVAKVSIAMYFLYTKLKYFLNNDCRTRRYWKN